MNSAQWWTLSAVRVRPGPAAPGACPGDTELSLIPGVPSGHEQGRLCRVPASGGGASAEPPGTASSPSAQRQTLPWSPVCLGTSGRCRRGYRVGEQEKTMQSLFFVRFYYQGKNLLILHLCCILISFKTVTWAIANTCLVNT